MRAADERKDDMTFTLGSWAIPLLATIAAFVVANVCVPKAKPSSYMPDPVPALAFLAFNGIAVILSLIV